MAQQPVIDDAPVTPAPPALPRRSRPVLSPLADTIGRALVFAPREQMWYTAATRSKTLLIDIGRVDADVRSTPRRIAAYEEAVAVLSPIRRGTRFRLYGAWGADDAVVSGFGWVNGRIVALVETTPRVQAIARSTEPLMVAAMRSDSAAEAVTSGCNRAVPDSLLGRAAAVRDSISRALIDSAAPPYERLATAMRLHTSRLPGCFGIGRVLVIVSLRAGDVEWVRERFVVIDEAGRVHRLRVSDYRFDAHDGVAALDADGDGVDDIALRGFATRAGGLVILRLSDGKRLERLTSGFAWELQ